MMRDIPSSVDERGFGAETILFYPSETGQNKTTKNSVALKLKQIYYGLNINFQSRHYILRGMTSLGKYIQLDGVCVEMINNRSKAAP